MSRQPEETQPNGSCVSASGMLLEGVSSARPDRFGSRCNEFTCLLSDRLPAAVGSIATAVCLLAFFMGSVDSAHGQYTANSLAELRNYAATVSNATITLAPGAYWIDGDHIADPTNSKPVFLDLGGVNNNYILTGTQLRLDTRDMAGFGRALGHDSGVVPVLISGSGNTINDLNLRGYDLDLASDPDSRRYADWASTYVQMTGDNNSVYGVDVLTAGSSPYGLGDAFGKGARQDPQGLPVEEGGLPWIGHNKTSAFNVLEATGAVIEDMHLSVGTYGHGFFVQLSDDTTLRDSTVTGVLFPSTNVINHEKYQEYGVTSHGNEIPDDIMISGAEDGVRMYTGASGLTVENVVVTNMRSGFAVALGRGDITLNNVEAYGVEQGFDFRWDTTITNAKGDITNGPLINVPYGNAANSSIEVELVGEAPVGHDWAVAYVSGDNVDVKISSDIPAEDLADTSLVRYGQIWWDNWRNTAGLTGPDDQAFDYINSTFINNTNQTSVLGIDVENNTGSSLAPVISNGKNNAYDGLSWVPQGYRTVVEHPNGLGNGGVTSAGTLDSNGTYVDDGGTLEISSGIQVIDERVTITGIGTDGKGAIYSDGTANNVTRLVSNSTGPSPVVVLNGDASIGVGIAGNMLLVDAVGGMGNLTKLGPGILSMEEASSFDGDLFVNEGSIIARANVVRTNLTVASAASIAAISSAYNTPEGTVQLNGTMDLNGRSDNNVILAVIGRLDGVGRVTASNPFVGAGGTLQIAGQTGSGAYLGGIDGFVNVIKSGENAQSLDGVMTHTGTTTVDAGTLLVNGTHTGGGDYTVNAGATLGGSGVIGSAVIVGDGGSLAPGSSPGTLDVGVLTLQSGSDLEIELGASGFDQVVADAASVSGSLTISLLDEGDGVFLPDSSGGYEILNADGALSGMFENAASNGVRVPTAGGEGVFSVVYISSLGSVFLADFRIAGDYNADGLVDSADYTLWRDAEGQTGLTPYSGADGNGDGQVNADDYVVWQSNYGSASTVASSHTIPEPTSLLSLLTFTVLLAGDRRMYSSARSA